MRKKSSELGITKNRYCRKLCGRHLAACAATLFDSPRNSSRLSMITMVSRYLYGRIIYKTL
jgi:hypothetical protein